MRKRWWRFFRNRAPLRPARRRGPHSLLKTRPPPSWTRSWPHKQAIRAWAGNRLGGPSRRIVPAWHARGAKGVPSGLAPQTIWSCVEAIRVSEISLIGSNMSPSAAASRSSAARNAASSKLIVIAVMTIFPCKALRQSVPPFGEDRPGVQRCRRWSGEPTAQRPRGGPGAASVILVQARRVALTKSTLPPVM